MSADLHHQLRDLFDELANELDPVVPDRFDPHRPTTLSVESTHQRRRPLLAAAAAITLITGTTVLLSQRHPDGTETPPIPASTTTPATTTTTTTPSPGTPVTGLEPDLRLPSVFPRFPADDPRNSAADPRYNAPGFAVDEGRALVGRIENGELLDPITIIVHADVDDHPVWNGLPEPLNSPAEEAVIEGVTYELHRKSGLMTLVLRGDHDVSVTGADVDTFVAEADGIPVTGITEAPGGGFSFTLTTLPSGYSSIVEPTAYPTEWSGQVILDVSGGVVTTSRSSPLLESPVGLRLWGRLRQVDINGARGWTYSMGTGFEDLVFEPAPGNWVMMQMVADALDVARAMEFVDEQAWQTTFAVNRPDLNAPEWNAPPPDPVLYPTPTTTPVADSAFEERMPAVYPVLPAGDPHTLDAAGYSAPTELSRSVPEVDAMWTVPHESRAVVGRIEDGQLVDRMTISVYDDIDARVTGEMSIRLDGIDGEVTVNGATYERHASVFSPPGGSTLVQRGEFDVAITGFDPEAFVTAAGGIPVVASTSPELGTSFVLGRLPNGYVEIVAPTAFPTPGASVSFLEGADTRLTLTASRQSPLLVPFANSWTYHQVDINGVQGWATDGGTSVLWQVTPGTWASVSGPDDVLELARSIEFVDENTWQTTYNVTRWNAPWPGG